MARTLEAAALLVAAALCLSSLLGFAYGHEKFTVIGKVYCDTCRVDFETKVSYGLPGTVRVNIFSSSNERYARRAYSLNEI